MYKCKCAQSQKCKIAGHNQKGANLQKKLSKLEHAKSQKCKITKLQICKTAQLLKFEKHKITKLLNHSNLKLI